jgi:GNAT superfamily N-acetyltransferase
VRGKPGHVHLLSAALSIEGGGTLGGGHSGHKQAAGNGGEGPHHGNSQGTLPRDPTSHGAEPFHISHKRASLPRRGYVRVVSLSPSRIEASRLVLVPVSSELAEAITAGDLSAVNPGEGWPHQGTLDGFRMALARGHAPGWLVTADGLTIGDCGVHGEPDEQGVVEIGFGLAAPYRGVGYGTELVIALSDWLLGQREVAQLCARAALDNWPSRRALERAGFRLESEDDQYARYLMDGGISRFPAARAGPPVETDR